MQYLLWGKRTYTTLCTTTNFSCQMIGNWNKESSLISSQILEWGLVSEVYFDQTLWQSTNSSKENCKNKSQTNPPDARILNCCYLWSHCNVESPTLLLLGSPSLLSFKLEPSLDVRMMYGQPPPTQEKMTKGFIQNWTSWRNKCLHTRSTFPAPKKTISM